MPGLKQRFGQLPDGRVRGVRKGAMRLSASGRVSGSRSK